MDGGIMQQGRDGGMMERGRRGGMKGGREGLSHLSEVNGMKCHGIVAGMY